MTPFVTVSELACSSTPLLAVYLPSIRCPPRLSTTLFLAMVNATPLVQNRTPFNVMLAISTCPQCALVANAAGVTAARFGTPAGAGEPAGVGAAARAARADPPPADAPDCTAHATLAPNPAHTSPASSHDRRPN